MLRSTSFNLRPFIKSLNVLDRILTGGIDNITEISNDRKDASILTSLFASALSGKQYVGNKYVWDSFTNFILNSRKLYLYINRLDRHCHNKKLLELIFNSLNERQKDEPLFHFLQKNENQNLFKTDVLKLFKNLNYLDIECFDYPFSLESLLSLIKGTKIRKIKIEGFWLKEFKASWPAFFYIQGIYEKAKFKMKFKDKGPKLAMELKIKYQRSLKMKGYVQWMR